MPTEEIRCIIENDFNLADFITIVISTINVIFVVWFYFNDKGQKKKESKQSYKMSWYRAFDFKDSISSLDSIFDKSKQNLLELLQSEEKNLDILKLQSKSYIDEFNNNLLREKERTVSILNCIDKSSGQLMANRYNEVQDKFLLLIQNCIFNTDSNSINIDKQILEMKSIIISCSYNIGLNFI